MSDNKQQWEPTGLERFSHLEDKIFRTVEEIKTVRKDNETLRSDNSRLKGQIEELQKKEAETQDVLAQFQLEREELRDRVEKTLNLLASLESRE
jgi:chromosome segregation ATPase